uniref:Uncharacterized protein n=1 Tax=Meloidogyne incognita TaxID=6306 RepID=A0A914LAH0_MELIC
MSDIHWELKKLKIFSNFKNIFGHTCHWLLLLFFGLFFIGYLTLHDALFCIIIILIFSVFLSSSLFTVHFNSALCLRLIVWCLSRVWICRHRCHRHHISWSKNDRWSAVVIFAGCTHWIYFGFCFPSFSIDQLRLLFFFRLFQCNSSDFIFLCCWCNSSSLCSDRRGLCTRTLFDVWFRLGFFWRKRSGERWPSSCRRSLNLHWFLRLFLLLDRSIRTWLFPSTDFCFRFPSIQRRFRANLYSRSILCLLFATLYKQNRRK